LLPLTIFDLEERYGDADLQRRQRRSRAARVAGDIVSREPFVGSGVGER
jgi:hypothetical protein